MPVISDTLVSVQCGDRRQVYRLGPQHLDDKPGSTLAGRALAFGDLLAYCDQGTWHYARTRAPIEELRVLALLDRAVDAGGPVRTWTGQVLSPRIPGLLPGR